MPSQKLEIPVIIAHDGNPEYLKLSLKSAANFNDKVLLIGDSTNKDVWENHWYIGADKLDRYREFMKNYVKMSDYAKEYEDSFWKRFFAIEFWMRNNSIGRVFLMDSDVISFANYSSEIYPNLPDGCIAAFMAGQNMNDNEDKDDFVYWCSSAHFSYWTFAALEDFISFCIQAYRDESILNKLKVKYSWHLANNSPGGVSEMTLLYLWSKKNSSQIFDLTQVVNGLTLDNNINCSENHFKNEYRMRFGYKSFVFRNGLPYGFSQILNREVRFLCVHCQGGAKSAMSFLYNQNLRQFYYFGKFIQTARVKLGRLKRIFIKKNNLVSFCWLPDS